MSGKKEKKVSEKANVADTDTGAVAAGGLAIVGDAGDGDAGENDTPNADIRRQVIALRNKADENYWELGVSLEKVYRKDLYREWGFDSWKSYIESPEVDIHIRKAQYLVKLQEWFGEMTPAVKDWVRSLGWTKARMLMHVINSQNAKEWKHRIEGKTVAEIDAMLKAEKNSDGDEEGGSDSSSSSDKPKALSIKGMHPEMLDAWERASSHAMEVGETDKLCQALNLICIHYLATSTNLDNKHDFLKMMEKLLGLRLVAIRETDDAVVFGSDYLAEQGAEDEDEDADEDGEEAGDTPESPVA